MNRGVLISFEGIDGVGKTTQLKRLTIYLQQAGYEVVTLREPGGTVISEKIRELLLDARNEGMNSVAEALLYSAARAQLVQETLNPLLDKGTIILADRFIDSTIAYQGYGRGLDINALHGLNRLATGGLDPDLTILLDLEASSAKERQAGGVPDRLEKEGLQFQQRVREGYLQLARECPRIVVINAAVELESVSENITSAVVAYLKGLD